MSKPNQNKHSIIYKTGRILKNETKLILFFFFLKKKTFYSLKLNLHIMYKHSRYVTSYDSPLTIFIYFLSLRVSRMHA